jgi:hypothetical protein
MRLSLLSGGFRSTVAFFAGSLCLGALGVSSTSAMVIVSDNFTNASAYGSQMVNLGGAGLSPSGANLPGGTWQAIGNDDYDNREFSGATPLCGQTNWASGRNNNGAALPIFSTGSYVEPTALHISATLSPFAGNSATTFGTEYLGFYSITTDSAHQYKYVPATNLVGLSLDQSGNLNFVVNGASNPSGSGASTIAAGTGVFDANGFTTLSFDLAFDTTSKVATLTNIVLNGASQGVTYTTGTLGDHAIDYAGFGGTNGGFTTGGMITSFAVSDVPEPAALSLLALSGTALLRRKARA